ncbi:MAG TPA: GntR family transcriptional regulator [Limnochorda sp.]
MTAPHRSPAADVEGRLIEAILAGQYAPGASLPAERELAQSLGVARPTLREALQRLAAQGWITIQQGRTTRVNDYWATGNPHMLAALAEHPERLPEAFVGWLLEARRALAPAYARAAVREGPAQVVACLAGAAELPSDDPWAFARFDWKLHRTLARLSGNPVYTWILNAYEDLYDRLAPRYFQQPVGRAFSRRFYERLLDAAMAQDAARAERVTRYAMAASLRLWQRLEPAARRPGGPDAQA